MSSALECGDLAVRDQPLSDASSGVLPGHVLQVGGEPLLTSLHRLLILCRGIVLKITRRTDGRID